VRSALTSAWPPPRKPMPPRPSKLDAFKPIIDDILRADLDAPRKQRHTVRRIHHRLLDEHGMADVSYQVVRTYVVDRKPKIRAEDEVSANIGSPDGDTRHRHWAVAGRRRS